MSKTIKVAIKNRIADLTEWINSTLVLKKGEIAFGTDGEDVIMKVGDGSKTWSNLSAAYPSKSVITTTTLSADSWVNQLYSFESIYPNTSYDIAVEIDGDSCTLAQCEAWDAAVVKGSPTKNVIKAFGTVPTIDIPIVVTYIKK